MSPRYNSNLLRFLSRNPGHDPDCYVAFDESRPLNLMPICGILKRFMCRAITQLWLLSHLACKEQKRKKLSSHAHRFAFISHIRYSYFITCNVCRIIPTHKLLYILRLFQLHTLFLRSGIAMRILT